MGLGRRSRAGGAGEPVGLRSRRCVREHRVLGVAVLRAAGSDDRLEPHACAGIRNVGRGPSCRGGEKGRGSRLMLFNSYEFIFLFLPITAIGFFVLSRAGWVGAAAAWLALASVFFYG